MREGVHWIVKTTGVTAVSVTGPSCIYQVASDTGRVVHCEHNHTDTDLELGRVTVSLTADHPLAWGPAERGR